MLGDNQAMEIMLVSGRRISLSGLHQGRTYDGVLAGRMDSYATERMIAQLLDEARRLSVEGCEPYLILPTPTLTDMPAGWTKQQLPRITCVADFRSTEL